MPAPREGIALRIGVDQVHDAALADHGIVVEVLLQPFPQLQRKFIKWLIAIQQIVGADNGGVAPHIASAQIALFQHRNACLIELTRQIIGRGQTMPATADDNVVIFSLRHRITPDGLPALVPSQCFNDDPETRIAQLCVLCSSFILSL